MHCKTARRHAALRRWRAATFLHFSLHQDGCKLLYNNKEARGTVVVRLPGKALEKFSSNDGLFQGRWV
jgi:hypothetical protein